MQSEDHKKKVRMITVQALSRLEELKLEDPVVSSQTSSSSVKNVTDKDLLSQLDSLPPPPSERPGSGGGGGGDTRRTATIPRG